MQHSVSTLRAKLRYHNTDLACDVVRGYAWYARCACGWVGQRRELQREAQADKQFHLWGEPPCSSGSATGGTEAS